MLHTFNFKALLLVDLGDVISDFKVIVESGALKKLLENGVTKYGINERNVSTEDFRYFIISLESLQFVTEVKLINVKLENDHIEVLLECLDNFGALESLLLNTCGINNAMAEKLIAKVKNLVNLKKLELSDNKIQDVFVDNFCAMILNAEHKLERINLHGNDLTKTSLNKLIDVSLKRESLLVIRFGQSQELANLMYVLNEEYPQLTLVPWDNRYVLEDDKRDGCNVFFQRENSDTTEFLTEEGFSVDLMYEMDDGACCIISTALALLKNKWIKIAKDYINIPLRDIRDEEEDGEPKLTLVEYVLTKGKRAKYQLHALKALKNFGADFEQISSDGITTLITMALDSNEKLVSSWASNQIMGHDDLDDLDDEDLIFDDDFINNLDLDQVDLSNVDIE